MALTHAQRTSMFNTLTEVMGQDDAETLMDHLPPSGWDNVATKDDLRAGFAEINAAIATGLAQAATERAQIKEAVTAGFAQAAVERTDIKTQAAIERADIKTQAAIERADIKTQAAIERADIKAQAAIGRADIKAEAAAGRAEIIRRQAWHLYIVVSTIVVASISIWIALLTQPGANG